MTGTISVVELNRAIRARPCPLCGARPGEGCWSTFVKRRMEHQVHEQRKKLA
jgi:hypothetical protein